MILRKSDPFKWFCVNGAYVGCDMLLLLIPAGAVPRIDDMGRDAAALRGRAVRLGRDSVVAFSELEKNFRSEIIALRAFLS